MTITVPKGDESAYRPRVESIEEMRGSIFKEVYRKAERCVEEIVAQAARGDSLAEQPEYSNIIAFPGRRGEGKTSAMLSVAGMLERGKRMDGERSWNASFVCLPMIDPSRLTEDETVLDVVLSRLYIKFDEACRGWGGVQSVSLEAKQKIYADFDRVYRALRAMNQSRGERHRQTDSLEGLRHVASGNDLRGLLYELVKHYMEAVGGDAERGRTRILVLPVDDVDLNIGQGYDICEELRKYFNLPNVVILFSLCMEQMNDIVRQEYLGDFRGLREAGETLGPANSVPEMATRYLEKLIPFGRRCILPSLSGNQLGKDTLLRDEEGRERDLVGAYLSLIEERTGVILVKDRLGTHAFLPTTLRGLMHLWAILKQMPEAYPDGRLDPVRRRQNLETLQQYVLQYNLPEFTHEMEEIIYVFMDTPDERLNQQLVRALCRGMDLDGAMDADTKAILRDMISEETTPENVSFGDVLFALHYYHGAKHRLDRTGERFVAVVRVMYSIRAQMILTRESGLADQKKALLGLLGGLLYTPSNQRVIRGGAWAGNCQISKIESCAREEKIDLEALRDALLVDTVFIKKNDNGDWRGFRTRGDEPYMESVDRNTLIGKKGNTEYFSLSYLACFTNCMRDDLTLESEPLKSAFAAWSEKYLSPIPVASADIIDNFVSGLWNSTLTPRKNGDSKNTALRNGINNLLKDLLERSGMAECRKVEWTQAWDEFPFLDNDFAEDYVSYLDELGSIERQKESVKALKNKLIAAKKILEDAQDVTALTNVRGKLVVRSKLLVEERRMIEDMKTYIDKVKDEMQPDSKEGLQLAISTIKDKINENLDRLEEKLQQLNAQAERS